MVRNVEHISSLSRIKETALTKNNNNNNNNNDKIMAIPITTTIISTRMKTNKGI